MSMSMCASLSVCDDISRTTLAIFTNFLCMLPTAVSQSSSGRVTKSQGRGQFWELSGHLKALATFAAAVAAAFAAKGIMRLPLTSCSRRDHSICQASANRNPENSERRRCGLSAGKGVHSGCKV